MDGVEATRGITALELDTKILVLTIHDEDEFLLPALDAAAAAAGFLNKSVADTDLMGAIEAVVRGHSYLPRRGPARASVPRSRCTRRAFRPGRRPRRCFPAPRPWRATSPRAKTKLGLHTRRDIVRFALEAGLLLAEGEQEGCPFPRTPTEVTGKARQGFAGIPPGIAGFSL
ncbi:hypothetical protein [Candidatus Palauibacter sp.]|uniref:hypothetical protein n=1 Tax=Candidatus Palauibacter sp. TaxID=3101350 RepID=UPI003CC5157A